MNFWACKNLYFLTFRAELYKISIAIYLVEICFCAGQLVFLSLYEKFQFRPSHLINFGASLMIVTHLLRWFQIPFSEVFWRTYHFYFHIDWNATSKTLLHDCHSSSIIHLMLHMYRYIDSLRIKYHLLSVVILVKMCVNVFSYNPITSCGKNFQKLQFIQQQLMNLIHL